MKNFKDFLKEEVDISKNKGIPSDFISKADQEARTSLGVRPDDESQMRTVFPEFDSNMRESNQLLTTGSQGQRLSQSEIKERIEKLEKLAEKVVREEFEEILDASIKPIEFKIELIPAGQVTSKISDLKDVSQQSKQPTDKQQEEQDKKDEEKRKKEDKERSEEEKRQHAEHGEPVPGTDLVDAIDKKKMLNMITQAAGKSTKDIIRYSDLVSQELSEIFGETSARILQCWVRMSDLADKMDWIIPIDRKSAMMKNMPIGMAGACQVKWESHSGNFYDIKLLLEKEATKITIHAVGIDFPMLIHETIKGIYLYLQSGAIKKDKETAKIIKAATSSFADEAQDFRYGPPALQMLLQFVNKFPESSRYKRLDTRVFTILALDKERAMDEAKSSKPEFKDALEKKAEVARTDKQFLEIMKSLFSVFDLQGSNWVIDESKFDTSLAKREIKKIVDYIVEEIEAHDAYLADLEEWEREQKEREESKNQPQFSQEEESDIDAIIKQSLYGKEEPSQSSDIDYSELTQREVQDLIDDALDAGDYERVKMLSQYLREGKEIYLRELERINESHNFHTRRNK